MAPFARGLRDGLNAFHAHSLVFITGSSDLKETGWRLAAKGGIRELRLPSSLRLCLQGGH